MPSSFSRDGGLLGVPSPSRDRPEGSRRQLPDVPISPKRPAAVSSLDAVSVVKAMQINMGEGG